MSDDEQEQHTRLDRIHRIELKNLYADLNSNALMLTSQKLAESSLTLLKNNKDLIPLKQLDKLKIATLSLGSDSVSAFQQHCSLYAPMSHFCLHKKARPAEYDNLMKELQAYNLILASVCNTDIRVIKNYGVEDDALAFINRLSEHKTVILSLFASPYVLSRLSNHTKTAAIVMAYEDKDMLQKAAAQLIFGAIPARGRLPVTASEHFAIGHGTDQNKIIRLKYTVPEEAGISTEALNPIDSIIHDAIAKHAMPGCQILLAKDGNVIYSKAFGYHTYDSLRPVKTTDIYDIASVTKIAATVPAVIRLYDNGDLSLSRKLGSSFHELRKSDKKDIKFKKNRSCWNS